jgi:hypothetical protein
MGALSLGIIAGAALDVLEEENFIKEEIHLLIGHSLRGPEACIRCSYKNRYRKPRINGTPTGNRYSAQCV